MNSMLIIGEKKNFTLVNNLGAAFILGVNSHVFEIIINPGGIAPRAAHPRGAGPFLKTAGGVAPCTPIISENQKCREQKIRTKEAGGNSESRCCCPCCQE